MLERPRSRRKWWFFAGLGIGVPAVAALLYLIWPDSGRGRADPGNPPFVAQGRELYARHCLSCHGRDLEGERDWQAPKASGRLPAPPHDEGGHTWHHSDGQLFALTKFGPQVYAGRGYQSDMPGFANQLGDDQIWAVLAYIKSRWPDAIRAYQRDITARARD
ncbi:MAG: cytochrome c [Alphaproteobacteria bacterium]|nr:cytochrome c [Alphaproteobacteria bacterium]